ncbi:MAG: peptidoglycan editing factor PgeF [Acidobacteriaceae bacterium]|jgi:YfiH family protein
MDWVESAEAIGEVDELLARVGLRHGRRKTLAGTWEGGERRGRSKPGAVNAQRVEREAGVVRAAGWEKYGWLRHGFSTRAGGVSPVYGEMSLNLGFTKEDDAANVAENRRRLVAAVTGARRAKLVTLRQIHSGLIRVVEADGALEGRLETVDGRAVLRGDGMMTNVPGVMLGVQVADCVPVLVADVRRRAVAAFHAGWRGTLKRIVERGIGTMRLRYGSRPEDLVAAVGPSIGACCYSVGEVVRHEFESQFAYVEELFSEVYDSDPVREKYPLLFLTARAPGHSNIGPQIHLDLWEANRRQLLDAGLKAKRIAVVGECSACARVKGGGLKYFSHRGESGFAGRMIGVVGLASA